MAIDPNAIWQQAQLDPSYIAGHSAAAQALKQLILGYGDTNALAPAEAARYGIQSNDVSAANQNPYSVQSQLAQQLAGDQTGIQRTANSHGALYSGANAAATAHELQAGGQRNYNALQTLQGQIAGIDSSDTSALTGAYGNLTNQALADQTIPVTPAAVAPNVPVAAPALPGTTPATATFAQNPAGYDPLAPQNTGQSTNLTVKPPKLPKLATGLQGHL